MLKKLLFSLCVALWGMVGICSAEDSAPVAELAQAVERLELRKIETLLSSDCDLDLAQSDGMTAMHWAAYHDRTELAFQLLKLGAKADEQNRYGTTPLALACLNGNAEIVVALLEADAKANHVLSGGESMLMIAARTGCEACVRALLEHGASVEHRDVSDQSAIMWASAEGHAEVVRLLVEAGADYARTLDSGFSAFMFAVREGRHEVVAALLNAGADVNEQMNPKHTGGRHARRGMSALHLAIENGHFDLAVQLLEAGADPNDQRCGFTPLHNISWVRKPPRGDDIDGAPPPIGSGVLTSLQLVDALIEHGADVNARLTKGKSGRGKMHEKLATPFLFAARRDDVPLMRQLLKHGADPTIPNADNCTALLVAAGIGTLAPGEEAGTEEEAIEAVELLLDLGAEINHVDNNGETAMHGAAYKSLPKMVALLGRRGAKVSVWNQKNKYGWTPTLIAEGHRPGNFKPAAETLQAIYQELLAAGVQPPPLTPPEHRKGYEQP